MVGIIRFMVHVMMIPIILAMPRRKRKIVFGAWEGDMFADNPKYLALYLSQNGLAECVWVGKPHLRKEVEGSGIRFVERGSLTALWHCLTAKWYVFCISLADIGFAPHCGQVKLLNLWHGIPYKKIGAKQLRYEVPKQESNIGYARKTYRKVVSRLYRYVYSEKMITCASSAKMVEIMCESWPRWFQTDRVVRSGLPRNDIMVEAKRNPNISRMAKQRLAAKFGWPGEKKWYLYMPTWRGDEPPYSFLNCKYTERLQQTLDQMGAVIIEKQHHSVLKHLKTEIGGISSRTILITKSQADEMDIQELLLAGDRLITDYSSCFFDYELTGRPVVHFAYDLERYEMSLAGVNYDLRKISAGPVVETEEEMLKTICLDDSELLDMYGEFSCEPLEYEKGCACETIARFMGLRQ